MGTNNNNGSFIPAIIYNNVDNNKSKILSDNKGRAAIYIWTNTLSGKRYVGSAIDLSKRLRDYYSPSYLKRANNYICNALICHTHSAFSLTILEYIGISNLSKDEARKKILEREQPYIDTLSPEYKILKVAGSSLGHELSEEVI